LAAVALATPVEARWKAEYASQPPEVQQWYRDAELTRAAQVRFPFKKCCDHADVVKTRFNVNRTNAGDEWYWLDGDKWRRISRRHHSLGSARAGRKADAVRL